MRNAFSKCRCGRKLIKENENDILLMKQLLRYIFLLFVFWIAVFAMQRAVFLIYNHNEIQGIAVSEILLSFWYGLRMDVSAFSYLTALPLLFLSVGFFIPRKIWVRMSDISAVFFLVIVLLIGLLDTGLYSVWGSKLNSKAISYVLFPGEAAKAFIAGPLWLFVLVFIAETALLLWVYFRWIRPRPLQKSNKIVGAVLILLLWATLVLALRGGFQKYPMGRNMVYYSRHMVLNYAALNGPWNLVDVIIRSKNEINPYRYFDEQMAEQIVQQMRQTGCDSIPQILNTPRPNIILILLESFSADNLMVLGGQEPVAPGLDSLAQQGLLFTDIYATGFRTEQGLISLLSAFPAQPTVTIMREFGKFEKLSNLGRVLIDAGYSCNYYYTGDLDFANTRAYLKASGFEKLHGKETGNWKRKTHYGAMDEELFQCHLEEAASDRQPFFSIIMTSTSHEPFDAPVNPVFSKSSTANCYKNTARYTDSCLYAYIQRAAQKDWYAKTLVIITADHAHSFPRSLAKYEPGRHHIPLLITGGALKSKWMGKSITRTGSQLDFTATLLSQLKIDFSRFTRSANLLDTCREAFAFYAFDNGFGIITPEKTLAFDHDLGQVVYRHASSEVISDSLLLNRGKAYLQIMYGEYLGLNK